MIKYGILLLLAFFPAFAFAADATAMLTPVPDDASINVLSQLFGAAMSTSSSSSANPFASFFQVFNSAAMIVAGLLASYTLIVGTMHTAHDGEALGKKWSSIAVPLNLALFTAMMIPLPSGLNTGEVIVMKSLESGIGLADTVWSAYVDSSYN